MLGIDWYSMSKTSDNAGYIVGGRSLGPATTAISAGASDMSGWLLLGLSGAMFVGGLSEGLWISMGLIIGAYINWKAVAAKLRGFSETLVAITLLTCIGERFEDKSSVLKIVAAVVILLFFTLYALRRFRPERWNLFIRPRLRCHRANCDDYYHPGGSFLYVSRWLTRCLLD
jgi:sodium/proline symporter